MSATVLGQGRQLPPLPLTSLVGRTDEVATACALLCDPAIRLVTLTGPGGVGKTRLALQVLTDVAAAFDDQVLFVALANVSDPELVVPAIAQMLGLREDGTQPLIE